jgi:nucleoside 2-deoxyribosyltransferase
MASCFIIMPLTTPEALVPAYGQDSDHFIHVLKHLFVPAVTRAEFTPILPIAQGADVIHAEIVKNLETADLVLCDISSLNPNVFFELGCRTALNKPVCYVMDDLTRGIPFDTGIINHHTYGHTLAPWTLDSEIEHLADHVRISAKRSAGKNMLWQYFGLRSVAHAAKSGDVDQDRLDYLVLQVEAIRKALDERTNTGGLMSFQSTPYEGEWTNANWLPANYQNTISFATPMHRDWDTVIKDSERDLEQISRLQKPDKIRLEPKHVRGIIEEHIRLLDELIGSEPNTERTTKARNLALQLRSILARQ